MLGLLLMILSWLNPLTWIKWVAVKLSCFLFNFGWYEGGFTKCLNKKGKDIIMITELKQDFVDLKENYRDLKKQNQNILKQNKEIKNLILESQKSKRIIKSQK